ncbi:MAG: ATP-binding cassette domain-containing protein [Spirochaetia bacterium]|jgi:ABC-2 type transport system ATP-binding protein|nr:ATP-binding cassette domain-containing protein [Spirochaetia bacterium]
MIDVVDLYKRYGTFEAVRGVSFTVGTGRVVGLLGPNGAGKTTIMKVLTGYHMPSSGRASIDGSDVLEEPLAVKASVGYLPEGVPLYLDMSVSDYLSFVAEARGMGRASKSASRAEATSAIENAIEKTLGACGLSSVRGMRMEKLSKGFRQRVGLAQAIIHDPSILILDEPTTGLDPNQILEIRSLIRSLGAEKTVILSTHILQEVEALCSEVLILNEGRIVAQGSAADIAAGMQGEEKLECVFKHDGPGILESLRALPGLGLVESLGSSRYRMVASQGSGDALAETVFDWAAGTGAKLLEMRRERMSMEDIFVRLTREDAL